MHDSVISQQEISNSTPNPPGSSHGSVSGGDSNTRLGKIKRRAPSIILSDKSLAGTFESRGSEISSARGTTNRSKSPRLRDKKKKAEGRPA